MHPMELKEWLIGCFATADYAQVFGPLPPPTIHKSIYLANFMNINAGFQVITFASPNGAKSSVDRSPDALRTGPQFGQSSSFRFQA
ncbi:hypothetical protein ABKN59_011228 [Abortiporus biennis]